MVLAGHSAPQTINVDSIQARLSRPDDFQVEQSLQEVGLGSPTALLATYAGQARDLAPWLVGLALLVYFIDLFIKRVRPTPPRA